MRLRAGDRASRAGFGGAAEEDHSEFIFKLEELGHTRLGSIAWPSRSGKGEFCFDKFGIAVESAFVPKNVASFPKGEELATRCSQSADGKPKHCHRIDRSAWSEGAKPGENHLRVHNHNRHSRSQKTIL